MLEVLLAPESKNCGKNDTETFYIMLILYQHLPFVRCGQCHRKCYAFDLQCLVGQSAVLVSIHGIKDTSGVPAEFVSTEKLVKAVNIQLAKVFNVNIDQIPLPKGTAAHS